MLSEAQLEQRFSYHAPHTEDIQFQHDQVRRGCETLASKFNSTLPESYEKYLAIEKLEEAMFWGNAAIARQQINPDQLNDK